MGLPRYSVGLEVYAFINHQAAFISQFHELITDIMMTDNWKASNYVRICIAVVCYRLKGSLYRVVV